VCQVGHLPELHKDARSEKYKIISDASVCWQILKNFNYHKFFKQLHDPSIRRQGNRTPIVAFLTIPSVITEKKEQSQRNIT
jgi:hypothetical protein